MAGRNSIVANGLPGRSATRAWITKGPSADVSSGPLKYTVNPCRPAPLPAASRSGRYSFATNRPKRLPLTKISTSTGWSGAMTSLHHSCKVLASARSMLPSIVPAPVVASTKVSGMVTVPAGALHRCRFARQPQPWPAQDARRHLPYMPNPIPERLCPACPVSQRNGDGAKARAFYPTTPPASRPDWLVATPKLLIQQIRERSPQQQRHLRERDGAVHPRRRSHHASRSAHLRSEQRR